MYIGISSYCRDASYVHMYAQMPSETSSIKLDRFGPKATCEKIVALSLAPLFSPQLTDCTEKEVVGITIVQLLRQNEGDRWQKLTDSGLAQTRPVSANKTKREKREIAAGMQSKQHYRAPPEWVCKICLQLF